MALSTDDYNRFGKMGRAVSFYAEDTDHVLRRRFIRLHWYNLYEKHRRLVELDQKISALEKPLVATGKESHHVPPTCEASGTLDKLLLEIDERLKDYDSASLLYQRSLQAPRIHKSFLDQVRTVTEHRATEFYKQYDIEDGWSECALHTATEKGVVHRCIDRCIIYSPFFKWLFIKNQENKTNIMLRYREARVRLTEDVSINIGFCAILLIPIFLLTYVQNKSWKLVIVACFVLFSTFLSSFMVTATQKPNLAIAAGYAAILVVFLGSSNT